MDKVVFSKFSKDRETRFQIATLILEREGKRIVRKEPIHEEGKEHILRMESSFQTLSELYDNSKISLSPCKVADGGVEFPYIPGSSMNSRIRSHANEGNFEKIKEDYRILWEIICSAKPMETFQRTPEFEKIFGTPAFKEGLQAASISNIDMIPDNIILGEKNYLVDYEWVFPFPIPVEFIYARSIFLQEAASALKAEEQLELYALAGIKKEEIRAYYEMEVRFQEYVAGPEEKYALSGIHKQMHNQVIPLSAWEYDKESFFMKVEAFRDHVWEEIFYQSYNGNRVEEEIPVEHTEEIEKFRITPVNGACILHLDELTAWIGEKEKQPEFTENKNAFLQNEYYFFGRPEILLENKNYEKLVLHYTVSDHGEKSMRQFTELINQKEEIAYQNRILQDRVTYLEEKVRQLENLRVYKAYRKVRRIVKRGNE